MSGISPEIPTGLRTLYEVFQHPGRVPVMHGKNAPPVRQGPTPSHWQPTKTYTMYHAESCDIALYLAGVNKHAGLPVAGNDQWRVSHLVGHFGFFDHEFISLQLEATRTGPVVEILCSLKHCAPTGTLYCTEQL